MIIIIFSFSPNPYQAISKPVSHQQYQENFDIYHSWALLTHQHHVEEPILGALVLWTYCNLQL